MGVEPAPYLFLIPDLYQEVVSPAVDFGLFLGASGGLDGGNHISGRVGLDAAVPAHGGHGKANHPLIL